MVKSNKQYKKEEIKYKKEIEEIRDRMNDISYRRSVAKIEMVKLRDSYIKRRLRELKTYKIDGEDCIERSYRQYKIKEPKLTLKKYIEIVN